MPQVAQQDYLKIASNARRDIISDANALAQIAGSLEKGTIFDVLLQDGRSNSLHRILMVKEYTDYKVLYYIDGRTGVLSSIYIDHTVTQYEGIAAIQVAEDERSGVAVLTLPTITCDENYFLMDDKQVVLICIDDYKLIVTDNEGIIGALSMSDQKPGPNVGYVNITWEDAQKLIGLPIA